VNPAANDYHLSATSPAVDRGVASFNGHAAPARDLQAAARPSGAAHDIGAYEYRSATQPTAPAAPPHCRRPRLRRAALDGCVV
jgi:hypothetical protein